MESLTSDRFLQITLTIFFIFPPFLLGLSGKAFYVAEIGLLCHNISHYLTDWNGVTKNKSCPKK